MDLSLEHIKEQHSSLSWLVAKYFLGQSCMWTIFLVCLFWPVSNHGVKIFEQTQWIFHWNLSKNNTLQFRWCMQSISSGSAVCELFFGFLFLAKIPSTEWKPSSRRFESFTATYQRTTLFNFMSGFKVFLLAAQHVDFLGELFTCQFSKTEWKPSSRRFGTLIGTPQSTTFLNFVDECKVIFNSIITLLTGILFLCSQWNLILCTERHIVVAMKMHASLVRFYRAAIWLVRANNITSEISLNNISLCHWEGMLL